MNYVNEVCQTRIRMVHLYKVHLTFRLPPTRKDGTRNMTIASQEIESGLIVRRMLSISQCHAGTSLQT